MEMVSGIHRYVCDRCCELAGACKRALVYATDSEYVDRVSLKKTASPSENDHVCSMCELLASLPLPAHPASSWQNPRTPQHFPSQLENGNEEGCYDVWAVHAIPLNQRKAALNCTTKNFNMGLVLGRSMDDTLTRGHTGPIDNEFIIDPPKAMVMLLKGSLEPEHARNQYCANAIDQEKAGFPSVRHWLSECLEHHAACAPRKDDLVYNIPKPSHVIDCETDMLGPLPNGALYVALSYVWGKQNLKRQSNTGSTDAKIHNVPRVVRDAMAVTKSLGHRFLWVDRYCINQSDNVHKMSQISVMDHIYENAAITLVDAVGEDDQHGLTGAGTYPLVVREKQKVARVGDSLFGLVETDITIALNSSTWAKRGWTYQETVLSTRCLFFTKTQIFLVCRTTSRCEGLPRRPKLSRHNQSELTLPYLFEKDSLDRKLAMHEWNQRTPTDRLARQISQYQGRMLTYEEDSLNAFRGILARCGFRSYWGIPLLESAGSDITSDKWEDMSDAYYRIQAAFIRGLCWFTSADDARRRHSMPTWSWVGLADCPISFTETPMDKGASINTLEFSDTRTEVYIPSSSSLSSETMHIGGIWVGDTASAGPGQVIQHDHKVLRLEVLAALVTKLITYHLKGSRQSTVFLNNGASNNVSGKPVRLDCFSEFAEDFYLDPSCTQEQVLVNPGLILVQLISAPMLNSGGLRYGGASQATHLLLQPVVTAKNTWRRIGIVRTSRAGLPGAYSPSHEEEFRRRGLLLV